MLKGVPPQKDHKVDRSAGKTVRKLQAYNCARVAPHKAVAEVSKIDKYRRGELL